MYTVSTSCDCGNGWTGDGHCSDIGIICSRRKAMLWSCTYVLPSDSFISLSQFANGVEGGRASTQGFSLIGRRCL